MTQISKRLEKLEAVIKGDDHIDLSHLSTPELKLIAGLKPGEDGTLDTSDLNKAEQQLLQAALNKLS